MMSQSPGATVTVADSYFASGMIAEGQAAHIEALDLSAGAAQDRIVVTGVDVIESAVNGIVLREKRGGETQSALAVAAGVAVHVGGEFGQGHLRRGKCFQAGLKRSHQHGSGNALAGNVGNCEHDAIVFDLSCRDAGTRRNSRQRRYWPDAWHRRSLVPESAEERQEEARSGSHARSADRASLPRGRQSPT